MRRTLLRASPRRGFTLIEILVVISIIIILVGTVLAIGAGVRARAQINQTKATLNVLKTALKDYLEQGNPESALTGITTPQPYLSTTAAQTGFATQFKAVPTIWKGIQGLSLGSSASTVTIVDGFGNPFQYIQSTADKPGFFQSAGPDGQYGTADDIYSYDP